MSTLPAPLPLLRPHLPLWVIVTLACFASFMVVMDGSIVNVALPAMQRDLRLSPAAQHWVIDAYLLSCGGSMLLAARAGDLYGRRPVLQAGLALFTLSSLAGGLASSGAILLAARAVQGLGAAVLATSSMAIVMAATHHDPAARGRALATWAAVNSAGFALGVVIGGVLTDSVGWRWVMYVNVPVGVLLMAGTAAALLPPAPRGQRPALDWPGAITATLGCSALVYGITQSATGGWASATVLGALAAALALLTLFVRIEQRSAAPLVRLSIFSAGNVRNGNLLMLCLGAALGASIYLVSITLQQVQGYSPYQTGLALLPMGISLAAARLVFAGRMTGGSARWRPVQGALVAAAGLAWLGFLPVQADYLAHVFGPVLLLGGGLGMVILAATHAVTAGIAPQDAGLASGLANTSRQLGGALGVAGLATLAVTVAQSRPAAVAPAIAQLQGLQVAFLATAGLTACAGLIALRMEPPG